MFRSFLVSLVAIIPFLLLSCSDDPGQPEIDEPETNTEIEEALAEYWGATESLSSSMANLNTIIGQMESAFETLGSKSDDTFNAQITTYVDQYVAETQQTALAFDGLLELESAIRAYGATPRYAVPADATGVQNMFTDTIGAVAKGLYNAGKKVVVDSGRMVRTSWRVLSGSHTLRDALGAPDSGIPIVSDMAKRLQEHNQARDERIVSSILRGDSQEGNVPIGQLEGETPEERASYYRNLPDSNPLKKETRGSVHIWDDGEKQETVKTLVKGASDMVKNYAGNVGGNVGAEVTEQLLTVGQDPNDKGTVQKTIKSEADGQSVTEPIMIIVSKRNQPISEQKIAVITGAPADVDLELPAGTYDILVAAEGYIRDVSTSIVVTADAVLEDLSEMFKYSDHSILLEEITVTPEQGMIGGRIDAQVAALSLTGAALTFDWNVTGPGVGTISEDATACSFTPSVMGDYTISVTVTDANGNTKSTSTSVAVVDIGVTVTEYAIASEQLQDQKWNPGEQLEVILSVSNAGDAAITGTMSVTGESGVIATGSLSDVTLPAGGVTDFPVDVSMPADYSSDAAVLVLSFATTDGLGEPVVVTDAYEFAVDFYVQIDAVASPVTDRVLTLTGTVANPSLTSATLVLDGDSDQAFVIGLNNGTFEQEVAIEASLQEENHTAEITAWSGSWDETGTMSFSSQVPPAGFRVTLTWDTYGTDVDLWTTDPNGEKCYYANETTASGLSLDFDNTSGYGPENITVGEPIPGAYLVQVHYYDDNDEEEAIHTNCTVIIRLNEGTEDEEIRTYYGGLSDSGDVWTVTTITIDGQGWLRTADTSGWGHCDPATLPEK